MDAIKVNVGRFEDLDVLLLDCGINLRKECDDGGIDYQNCGSMDNLDAFIEYL